jgi:hypothetical protein
MARRKPPVQRMRQVNFRIPLLVWQRLTAAADVLGQPQSQIVSDALLRYFETLQPATRHLLEQVLALRDPGMTKRKGPGRR